MSEVSFGGVYRWRTGAEHPVWGGSDYCRPNGPRVKVAEASCIGVWREGAVFKKVLNVSHERRLEGVTEGASVLGGLVARPPAGIVGI